MVSGRIRARVGYLAGMVWRVLAGFYSCITGRICQAQRVLPGRTSLGRHIPQSIEGLLWSQSWI